MLKKALTAIEQVKKLTFLSSFFNPLFFFIFHIYCFNTTRSMFLVATLEPSYLNEKVTGYKPRVRVQDKT